MANTDPKPLPPEGIYSKRWQVIGTSGKPWIVSIKSTDNSWGCSCPAWTMKKVHPRPDCQHILRTKIFTGAFGKPVVQGVAVKKTDPQVTRAITFED